MKSVIMPCPVCGRMDVELDYTCKICGWQNFSSQLRNPDHEGPNKISLNESRKLWSIGESVFYAFPNLI